MRFVSILVAATVGSVLSGATLWACTPDSSLTTTSTSSGTGGTGGELFGGSPTAGGTGGTTTDASVDNTCGYTTEKANTHPVTLYIMMDKSSSMAGFKWDAAVAGLTAFVSDQASAGLTVGLRFFPRPPDAIPACDQKVYQVPDVPFGLLPGNTQPIVDALNAAAPDGFSTPIYPALGGAILAGIDNALNDPNVRTAVLLVTDGTPQGPAPTCGGVDPEATPVIEDLAKTGAEYSPPVLTYVIGLPGADQTFANAVAAAGGTDSALLVSNVNVEQAFVDALNKVRGDALPCDYEIPKAVGVGEFEVSEVNVLVTYSGKEPEFLSQVSACGEGWKYDDPVNPKRIVLCPDTCDKLHTDFGAKIEIALGCETIIK
ncbi:MAG: VWA domain-containing protein [Polyangiaceae bacterium]|nr:VWA domain-containing protein [Polyangiaceae bacterium]